MNERRSHAVSRGVLAAAALLVLLVVLPVSLAIGVGWPLPTQWPTTTGLQHALTRPIADSTLLKTIALLAWVAWLRLFVAVLDELRAQLTGYPSRPHLLIGSLNRTVAHRLVATVLIAMPNLTAVAHAASIDSLTRATTTLSVPERAAAAAGKASPAVDAPSQHGWHPDLSAGPRPKPVAGKVYVVQSAHGRHYDSLWDIAARHLGDGRRYPEIYELNRGRRQPDGGELTRASLIQPGWLLLLPADAVGTDLHPVHEFVEPAAGPAHVSGKPRQSTAKKAASNPATAGARGPAAIARTSPAQTAKQARTGSGPETTSTEQHTSIPVDLGLGLGAVGVLGALLRARRVAQRRRRVGYRPGLPPVESRAAEAALHREARTAVAIGQRVRAAAALATKAAPGVVVLGALAQPDGAVELFAGASGSPPPPFKDSDGRWLLAGEDAAYTFVVDDDVDPHPLLAPVGCSGAAQMFIDLEQAGLTAIAGDATRIEDLLVHLVTGLAGAPWAELAEVLVPPTLAARIGPIDRVVGVLSLDERVEELLRYTRAASAEDAHDSLASARRSGAGGDVLLRVLVGWSADELPDELAAAITDVRSPVVAVVVGDDDRATVTWELFDEGLRLPTVARVVTPPLHSRAAEAVTDLLSQTRTAVDVPADDPHYQQLLADTPPEEQHASIEVAILGPVELRGVEQPRRTPVLHILVYLALHRRGVTAEQLSTALSPDAALASTTLRNRIAEARAIVGGAISKAPRWRLSKEVGCDWQRFRALAAGEFAQQRQALELVRGRPFDGFLDAEWTHVEGIRTEIESAIVDVAVQVGEHALADGDPLAAEQAVAVGLKACPYDERLFRIAMRAADVRGATSKVQALMAQLRGVMGVEVEPDDTISAETLDLYAEIVRRAPVAVTTHD